MEDPDMKLILAAVFAVLAAPVFAADPTAMTCKDMMAMDATGMATAGTAMKTAMQDDAKVSAMADADVASSAKIACTGHPDGTVMDAMKASMKSDPATMTCKDLMSMDKNGMAAAGMAMKMTMKDDAKVTGMSDADATTAAETACKAKPDGTVMDAMKM
jgi:opacity protein-like surface antigen